MAPFVSNKLPSFLLPLQGPKCGLITYLIYENVKQCYMQSHVNSVNIVVSCHSCLIDRERLPDEQ